jgi:heptosyltransferase-2
VLLGHVAARCKAGYFSRVMPSDMAIVLPHAPIHPPDTSSIVPHQRHLMMQLVSTVVASLDPLADGQRLLERLGSEYAEAASEMRREWRGPVVVMNTSSGRALKNWPLENFISICRWTEKDLGGTVVLVGGPAQKREAAQIARSMGPGSLVNLVAAIPLEQAIAVLQRADLFLGNDSGLTHAAATMGVPTVALYSGIDPIATWGPLGPNVTAIKSQAACAPCHLTHKTDCVHGQICMRAIPVDMVKQMMLRHLSPRPEALLVSDAS